MKFLPRSRAGVVWTVVRVSLVIAFLVGVACWAMWPRYGSGMNETAAMAALRTYLGAQNQFRRKAYYGEDVGLVYANPWNGNGFRDLGDVTRKRHDGVEHALVDKAFAEAVPGGTPRAGYLFCDIVGRAGIGPYDYTKECGLCAYPAEFNVTGRNTFIIDVTGVVYQAFMGGKPVTKYPDVKAEGWVPVGQ